MRDQRDAEPWTPCRVDLECTGKANEACPQVGVRAHRPRSNEAPQALAEKEARAHVRVRRALAVDPRVVRQEVLREGVRTVEVEWLAVTVAPAAQVRCEDGDARPREPLRQLHIDA